MVPISFIFRAAVEKQDREQNSGHRGRGGRRVRCVGEEHGN